jgi:FMN phosphatase YigB (HAD superfamily)
MSKSVTQALVFDLGKVLVDFSMEKACAQIAQVSQQDPSAIRSFLFDEGHELRFEAGSISFDELHHLFEQRFHVTVAATDLMKAASDIFTPIKENLWLVQQLSERYRSQVPLVLLSNTNEIHWQHIEQQWNPSRWFDHLILSFEVKSLKPSEDIYRHVTALTGHSLDRCFFIDDVPANIDGARRAGLQAELYTHPEKLRSSLQQRGFFAEMELQN